MKHLEEKRVSPSVIHGILDILDEKSKVRMSKDKMRKVKIENLMIRAYLDCPTMGYADCLKEVKLHLPDYSAEDSPIRERAETMRISEKELRAELSQWAFRVIGLIYEGMAGNKDAIKKAEEMVAGQYSDKGVYHQTQEQFVLNGLVCSIPQLADSPARDQVLELGRKYCIVCLRYIIRSISFDIGADDLDPEIEKMTDLNELRRKVYLARTQLKEYKELVEAADAEFDNKLEALHQQERIAFFTSLNNEKYGYLIDSLYLQKKACMECKRTGQHLPFILEGVPAFTDRLLSFLKDSGVVPASRYEPNSLQRLTLEQMRDCRFEPHPARQTAIRRDEVLTVRVVSSGWRLNDVIISLPLLQEELSDI